MDGDGGWALGYNAPTMYPLDTASSATFDNRIDAVLAAQPPGLWPFIPAGYPDVATTTALLERLADLPIRGVEIGFPFSDPIADGPVIQQAFTETLATNVRVDDIFAAVAEARERKNPHPAPLPKREREKIRKNPHPAPPPQREREKMTADYPMLAMVSASIVYRIGVASFIDRARGAGFDGLIIPDLSLEEAGHIAKPIRAAGLRLAMLVAPTTPHSRRERIAAAAGGFLYYVSVQGTTGQRVDLAADLQAQVQDLRAAAGLPVLVGFGISTAEHVRRTCSFADGAIVGSAIVRRMIELAHGGATGERFVDATAAFVSSLI